MSEPKSMKETIRPLLVVNLLFGMGTFPDRKKCVRLSEYINTIIFLVLYNVLNVFSWPNFKQYYIISIYNLCKETNFYTSLFNYLIINGLVITTCTRAKNLRTVISLVESCDRKIEEMGVPRNYGKLVKYQIKGFVSFALTLFFFLSVVHIWRFKKSTPLIIKLYLNLIGHMPIIIIWLCNFSFCFWIRYFRMKFQQLNGLLRSMVTTTPDSPQHQRVLKMKYDFENNGSRSARDNRVHGSKANAVTIRSVKKMHLEIIKIVRIVNDIFGVQILLLMVVSIISVTTLFYLLYRITWLELTIDSYLQELVPLSCWIFYYIMLIFYINHVCAKTITEAASIGDIICELYEPSTSAEFRAEIQDFTLQLIQNPLVFTACGFFNLDHAFIQGVVGTITTYLIIIIQVGDMANSHLEAIGGKKLKNETSTTIESVTITSLSLYTHEGLAIN